jgi:hypothetical protein
VYIDVQISLFEALVLIVRELGAFRYGPGVIRRFVQGDDGRPVLSRLGEMDVGHRALDSGCFDVPAPVAADVTAGTSWSPVNLTATSAAFADKPPTAKPAARAIGANRKVRVDFTGVSS